MCMVSELRLIHVVDVVNYVFASLSANRSCKAPASGEILVKFTEPNLNKYISNVIHRSIINSGQFYQPLFKYLKQKFKIYS